jgi:hypothetical protein
MKPPAFAPTVFLHTMPESSCPFSTNTTVSSSNSSPVRLSLCVLQEVTISFSGETGAVPVMTAEVDALWNHQAEQLLSSPELLGLQDGRYGNLVDV